MSNRKVILSVFIVFFAMCFSGTVLFADEMPPLEKYEGPIKPGIELTKDNWDQYRPELEKLVPASRLSYADLSVNSGGVTIPIVERCEGCQLITPAWKEASLKHEGTARIDPETHWLTDWQGGYAFPHPKNAWELLWDIYTLINRTYGGHDDMRLYHNLLMFDKDKYQKRFSWIIQGRKYTNRVEIEPFGTMEAFTKTGIVQKEAMVVTEPHDVRGFCILRHKYWSPTTPDDVYAYIPALKRIRRLTGGDLTDPLLGSDVIPDDFQVCQQKVFPEQTARVIARREMLAPSPTKGWLEENPDIRPAYKLDSRSIGFPESWEIRPQWIFELSINDPDYIYSKRILYVEAVPLEEGGSFIPYWGEQYDMAGRMWRANGPLALGINPLGFNHLFGCLYMDCLKNHYTLMPGYSSNHSKEEWEKYYPLKESILTIQGLLREAR